MRAGQVLAWDPPLPGAWESFLPLLFSECLLRFPEACKGTMQLLIVCLESTLYSWEQL